ncbi:hypothetical protein Q9314_24880 (plasmid) [Shinella sumterensis]|nr:hypothetical protein Q9314_24880 [Shinella sumterensis]
MKTQTDAYLTVLTRLLQLPVSLKREGQDGSRHDIVGPDDREIYRNGGSNKTREMLIEHYPMLGKSMRDLVTVLGNE